MGRFWGYLGASLIVVVMAGAIPAMRESYVIHYGVPIAFIDHWDLHFSAFLLDLVIFFGPVALVGRFMEERARKKGVRQSDVDSALRILSIIGFALVAVLYAYILFGHEGRGQWHFRWGAW